MDNPAAPVPSPVTSVAAPLAEYPQLSDPTNRELQATMIAEVRSLFRDLQQPARMDSEIASIDKQTAEIMETAQAQLDRLDQRRARLVERRANIRELYITASEQLDELNGRLRVQQNRGAIQQLLDMKRKIAEMEAAGIDTSILFQNETVETTDVTTTPEPESAAMEAA